MKTASSRPPWADHSEAGTLGDWGGEPGQAYKLCVPHQELHPHHGPPAVTLENDLHIPIYLGGTKVRDRMWQKSVNRAGSLRKESRPMSEKSEGSGRGSGASDGGSLSSLVAPEGSGWCPHAFVLLAPELSLLLSLVTSWLPYP